MDIKSPTLLKIKGLLFLVLGLLSLTGVLFLAPDLRVLGFCLIMIWAFSRFYYFAFYVLEHYADSRFHYAGLLHLCRYLLGRKPENRNAPPPGA